MVVDKTDAEAAGRRQADSRITSTGKIDCWSHQDSLTAERDKPAIDVVIE